MRRTIFLALGCLELIVALMLVNLGRRIPPVAEVERSFRSAERVTDRAGNQVRLLRQQVQGLQRMQLQQLSSRLQRETRAITAQLKTQSVDFDTVRTMRDAMGEVAQGLESLSETLDPDAIGKLSTGLGETANFLDQKVVPTAKQAADHLEKTTASLQDDARELATLLRESPPDLKAVREVYNSLARFRDGLGKMNTVLKLPRLETMREGFRGMETALTTGSEQIERLSSYTYPVVSLNGLKPEINQKSFWPEGDKIADGMRKAAAGATAGRKEMEGLAADLPKIRDSLTESCNMVDKVREALGVALEHQAKVEPLLKDFPAHTARLAEELPQISGNLTKILRDTQGLKEVAAALRQAQSGIDSAVARWPDLRITLAKLAVVLKATRDQLDHAVKHRREYEAGMQQTVQLADTFAAMLPLITDQLDGRLDEEERTLADLGHSLDDVGTALPAYAQTTSQLLQTGRWLAWLVAAIVGLHGCYLMLSVRMGWRYSV
jgi:ABC-type transporter Mla subunit MlaD